MAPRKPRADATGSVSASSEGELIVAPTETIHALGGDEHIARLLSDIVQAHDCTIKAQSIAVLYAIKCGHRLRTLKTHVGHGNFGPVQEFLKEHYGISERTIQRYIQLATNEELIVARLRDLNPPQVADLSDEQVLEATTITRALQVLVEGDDKDSKNDKSKASPSSNNKKSHSARTKTASWEDCHVPFEFMSVLPKIWNAVDIFVSFVGEFLEPSFGYSHPSAKQPDATVGDLAGRVLVNAIRKDVAIDLLKTVVDRFREGAVSEAFIALSCSANTEALAAVRSFPRLILRQHPYVEDPESGTGKAKQPYPCVVMVVLLVKAERLTELAVVFDGIADLYLPYVAPM